MGQGGGRDGQGEKEMNPCVPLCSHVPSSLSNVDISRLSPALNVGTKLGHAGTFRQSSAGRGLWQSGSQTHASSSRHAHRTHSAAESDLDAFRETFPDGIAGSSGAVPGCDSARRGSCLPQIQSQWGIQRLFYAATRNTPDLLSGRKCQQTLRNKGFRFTPSL